MKTNLILAAYILDLMFGDPRWLPHPVRIIGKIISWLDNTLNKSSVGKVWKHVFGIATVFIVVGVSGSAAYIILDIVGKINPVFKAVVWVLIAYTTLAIKDLRVHALSVYSALEKNDIAQARLRLSSIVGRDTSGLSAGEITAAAVETVAESTTDGIIAPLFYLFLGGPVLALMFKAVSTLDSMIGHKSERYLYFGWCAAKLDDVCNFFPARITGVLIAVSAFLLNKDSAAAFKIMIRDGQKQDSPNSAVSESAMAGALGIVLGGKCVYSGNAVYHPYLGDRRVDISFAHIKDALDISLVSSFIAVLSAVALTNLI